MIRGNRRVAIREPGLWMANIWLMFLLFPLLSIVSDDNLSVSRKSIGVGLLVLFAVVHVLGYRVLVRTERGSPALSQRTGWVGLIDPDGTQLWFGLLVVIIAVGSFVTGWAMIGAMPFIVSFAIFNFSGRAAAIVVALSFVVVAGLPVVLGRFGELWFFTGILASATFAIAFTKFADDREQHLAALRSQLMLSEERARVGRDVHDVLGHSLTAIVLKAQVAERALASIESPTPAIETARTQLLETQDISRRALAEIRTTVSGLRSSDLDDELAAARSVLADAGVNLTVSGDSSDIRAEHREVMGWVVREAVTNIVRHAHAGECTIELGGPKHLLRIADDGTGRNGHRPDGAHEGNGLTGLRERLGAHQLDLMIADHDGMTLCVVKSAGSR